MPKVSLYTCLGTIFALNAFFHNTAFAQTSKLANEHQSFTLQVATSVSYGANGVFVSKTMAAGAYTCSNAVFGDPISGVTKSCYILTAKLADEYGSFTLVSSTSVNYGANGLFANKTLAAGSYTCSNAIFGDPVSGVLKSCYISTATTTTAQTLLTAQSGTFKLASNSVISYGANGTFVQKSLNAGTYVCGDQLFGNPLGGVVKACYSTSTVSTPVSVISQLALIVPQSSLFTLTVATNVVYGMGGQTVQKTLAAGTYQCSDSLFGDSAVGTVKACYKAGTSTAAPADTTLVTC